MKQSWRSRVTLSKVGPRPDSRSDQPAAMEVDLMNWMRAALIAMTAIGQHLLVLGLLVLFGFS
ncbi:hypothetical protein GCM10010303_01480 [Streptomyces purpurascens]|nr:hypothetical protein GCM10010303_01480 [Streptomyces purpurascens]